MSRARSVGWVAVGLAVAAAAGVMLWRQRSAPEPRDEFVTATVDRGSIVGRVTATGTVAALVTVQVGTQVSGRIRALSADFNATVKKGQVLARLEPDIFEAALSQARANVQAAEGNAAKARAQAADAERKLARARQLAEQRLVAQADLDSAVAEAEIARASVRAAEGTLAQAQAQRHQAEVNLGYTTIRSPIDGTVISRSVDVGQTVAASLSSPTLFTIAENLARMQVDTNVAEADVGKLREGLEATFTVDAFPGRAFSGRIRQIRFAPQVVQNVVTYVAVIDVENAEQRLRPGMTANVTFVHSRSDDVLRVPNAALRFRLDTDGRGAARADGGWAGRRDGGADGGRARPHGAPGPGAGDGGSATEARGLRRSVVLLGPDGPRTVWLRTGATDGSFTEVLEGEVREGDAVIVDRRGAARSTPASSGLRIPGMAPPGGMGGPRRGL